MSGWLDFLAEPAAEESAGQDADAPALHEDVPVALHEDVAAALHEEGAAERRQQAQHRRGRPSGQHGSHMYRAALRSQEELEAQQMAARTIADARAALQRQRAARVHEQRAQQETIQQVQGQLVSTGSCLQQALAQHIMTTAALSQKLDDNPQETARTLMQTVSRSVTSKKAEAENLQESSYVLARRYMQCAAGIVNFSGLLWEQLLVLLAHLCNDGQCTPWALIIKRRYDETPSRIRVPLPAGGGAKESNTLAKILQSEMQVIVMLEHTASNKCVMLTGHLPTWLQAIERNTAECIKRCQKQLESVVPKLHMVSRMFKLPEPRRTSK